MFIGVLVTVTNDNASRLCTGRGAWGGTPPRSPNIVRPYSRCVVFLVWGIPWRVCADGHMGGGCPCLFDPYFIWVWIPSLGAFDPFLVAGLGCLGGVPFYFVCPVRGAEWAACDVFGVAALEGLLLASGLVGSDTLLSEPDGFDLGPYFGDDNMGLGGVAGGALGLVVAANASLGQSGVFGWFLILVHIFRFASPVQYPVPYPTECG